MRSNIIFAWPQKGSGASGFLLMALFFPLLLIRFFEQWAHRDSWEFLMWAALFLAWVVVWPIALLRRLERIGLNRAWALPILIPAALLLVALFRDWPHGVAVAIAPVSIASAAVLIFFSEPKKVQP